jgi:hypothetical protein
MSQIVAVLKGAWGTLQGNPLLLMIGIMTAGLGFRSLYLAEPRKRWPQFLGFGLALIGTSLIALFVFFRYTNANGGPGFSFGPGYPLIPWMGVMAAGYGFGSLYLLEPRQRRPQLLALGLSLIALFIFLRYTNLYGDRSIRLGGARGVPGMPWSIWTEAPGPDGATRRVPHPYPPGFQLTADPKGAASAERGPDENVNWWLTLFSFLNCHKYPPSLLYLLMTLGPSITLLGLFEGLHGPIARFFVVFGRVPLFYYLLHLPLIHGLAVGIDYLRDHYAMPSWFNELFSADYNQYDLLKVYVVWISVVLFLYPFCYWFAGVKRRSRAAWLSYL